MACKSRIKKPRRMSAGGILTSTATGAATGAVGGPIGAVVGGAIGLASGVISHINDKKQRDAQENMLRQQELLRRQQKFASELEFQPANIPLMPFGGSVPYTNETVELEAGEPFKSPNGIINSIPNNAPTHAQGGVPITLPSGTKVLGKKPATDEKTFKELGAKLEKQQKKYRKILDNKPSRLEEETATRMLDKINTQFNELFDLQGEDIPGSNQMPEGGMVADTVAQHVLDQYRSQSIQSQEYGDFDKADYGDLLRSTPLYNPTKRNSIVATENYYKGVPGAYYSLPNDTNKGARIEKYITPEGKTRFAGSEIPKYPNGGITGTATNYFANNPNDLLNFQKFAGAQPDNVLGTNTLDAWNNLGQSYLNTSQGLPAMQGLPGTIPTTATEGLSQQTINQIQPSSISTTTSPIQQGTGFNAGNVLGTIGSLAPVAYNLMQGLRGVERSEASDFYNPYEASARSLMRQRRYNIQPELEQNRLNQATYYRNLREGAPSQSQYLGGLQAGAIGKSRADAQAIARQQNINNQYLGEQAQLDVSLGAQRAATDFRVDQMNAQNRAARRNMIGTGLSQIGKFAQNQQLMNNQMIRDAQRLNLLPALIQNFELAEDGSWKFKETGQKVNTFDVMNYIKGQNIK